MTFSISPLGLDLVNAVERRDLLRPRVLEPRGERDLAEVDVEGAAPDRQPADVAQCFAARQGQDQVLLAVGLERDERGLELGSQEMALRLENSNRRCIT